MTYIIETQNPNESHRIFREIVNFADSSLTFLDYTKPGNSFDEASAMKSAQEEIYAEG